MKTEPCKGCGRPIAWVRSQTGKSVPLNPEPDPHGNIVVRDGVAVYLSRKRPLGLFDGPTYTSHFSDCPVAHQFRKKP